MCGRGITSPILYVSTYPDMISVGKAYENAAAPMAHITDRIQSLADEVTKGLKDDAAKVKALDHWVTKNIRYVSVSLGHGALIPHPADQVLTNRYGDCKDHAILMQALLAAVGIQSSMALVSSGIAYTISTVGSLLRRIMRLLMFRVSTCTWIRPISSPIMGRCPSASWTSRRY